MPQFFVAYAASAVTLLVMDVIWLNVANGLLYRPLLGDKLSDQPNLAVAAGFYLVYVIGVVIFAVLPAYDAKAPLMALGLGALLGLVAYGTYDFTNLATLRGWPATLSFIDVTWGIFLTATSALAGYWATAWLTSN
jgi:uncharacterized membrane protein